MKASSSMIEACPYECVYAQVSAPLALFRRRFQDLSVCAKFRSFAQIGSSGRTGLTRSGRSLLRHRVHSHISHHLPLGMELRTSQPLAHEMEEPLLNAGGGCATSDVAALVMRHT